MQLQPPVGVKRIGCEPAIMRAHTLPQPMAAAQVVGGNGGNAGANAIQQKCAESDVVCSVIGVPKSIDNDILLIDKCFGFDTAVEEAQRALLAAKVRGRPRCALGRPLAVLAALHGGLAVRGHSPRAHHHPATARRQVEASSARNGIGVVKLMGRQSGFIAVQASMASGVVDAVLIPEVTFKLEGPTGLLAYLEKVLQNKGHAVLCVAEGAGQVGAAAACACLCALWGVHGCRGRRWVVTSWGRLRAPCRRPWTPP